MFFHAHTNQKSLDQEIQTSTIDVFYFIFEKNVGVTLFYFLFFLGGALCSLKSLFIYLLTKARVFFVSANK